MTHDRRICPRSAVPAAHGADGTGWRCATGERVSPQRLARPVRDGRLSPAGSWRSDADDRSARPHHLARHADAGGHRDARPAAARRRHSAACRVGAGARVGDRTGSRPVRSARRRRGVRPAPPARRRGSPPQSRAPPGRTDLLFDALAQVIIEQKVTLRQAFGAWRQIVSRFGERAPGPTPVALFAPPTPEGWRRIPSWAWHRAGLEPPQSRTIVAVAARAPGLERAAAAVTSTRP